MRLLEDSILTEEKEYIEHDFQRVIGKSDLVKTVDTDDIIYAKRMNRDNYSRFVTNKKPIDSSVLAAVLY